MDSIYHRIKSIAVSREQSRQHQWIRVLLTEEDGREHEIDIFGSTATPSLKLQGLMEEAA